MKKENDAGFAVETSGDLEELILRETHSLLAKIMYSDLHQVVGTQYQDIPQTWDRLIKKLMEWFKSNRFR